MERQGWDNMKHILINKLPFVSEKELRWKPGRGPEKKALYRGLAENCHHLSLTCTDFGHTLSSPPLTVSGRLLYMDPSNSQKPTHWPTISVIILSLALKIHLYQRFCILHKRKYSLLSLVCILSWEYHVIKRCKKTVD